MGIILGEAAHTHQTVELTGFLMTVYQTKLSHAERQISVGTGLGLVYQHAARAVHGFYWQNPVSSMTVVYIFSL